MLANGADPNIVDSHTNKTALEVAVESVARDQDTASQMVQILASSPMTRDIDERALKIVNAYLNTYDTPALQQIYISCMVIKARLAPGARAAEWVDAVRFNEPETVRALLRGGDPNTADPVTGKAALHIAAEHRSLAVARVLVSDLRTVDSRDKNNQRAFDIVDAYAKRVDPQGTDQDVKEFFDCFKTIRNRRLEPQDAVRENDPDLLRAYLAHRGDPNVQDPVTGQTALHLVALSGNLEMARALANDKRTEDLRDGNHERAFEIFNARAAEHRNPQTKQLLNCFMIIRNRRLEPQDAVRDGNPDLLRAYLSDQGDPNFQDPVTGKTALHLVAESVAESKSLEMAEILVGDDRTIELRDRNNRRPLEIVTEYATQVDPDNLDSEVRDLVNCFKTIRDRHPEPQDAVRQRDPDLLQSYLDRGGDPNFQDPATGRTALHLVAESLSLQMADILASNRGTRDLPDGSGQLAFDIARDRARSVDPTGTNRAIRQFFQHFITIRDQTPPSDGTQRGRPNLAGPNLAEWQTGQVLPE